MKTIYTIPKPDNSKYIADNGEPFTVKIYTDYNMHSFMVKHKIESMCIAGSLYNGIKYLLDVIVVFDRGGVDDFRTIIQYDDGYELVKQDVECLSYDRLCCDFQVALNVRK